MRLSLAPPATVPWSSRRHVSNWVSNLRPSIGLTLRGPTRNCLVNTIGTQLPGDNHPQSPGDIGSAHNQTLDEHNKCGAADPYSKTGSSTGLGDGEYCGVGCLGEACLYYQIGCYAGCPTCSLTGKDLYPTSADLRLADHCEPIEPTLGGGDPAVRRSGLPRTPDGQASV